MLTLRNIDTFYGSSRALFGLSLEIGRGEMVSLLGRNGMGKTTTVRSVMGLTPVRGGQIRFDGVDIHRMAAHRIARMGIGLVPEGRQIFPNLTVHENLVATARNGVPPEDAWTVEKVYDFFPQLESRAGFMGNALSGGEQQMLAIGRALMTNPRLLILDEATEGLAPKIRSFIWKTLRRLKERGLSILVIDKNVDALMRICDRHYIIEKGKTVWEGTSGELAGAPGVRRGDLGV